MQDGALSGSGIATPRFTHSYTYSSIGQLTTESFTTTVGRTLTRVYEIDGPVPGRSIGWDLHTPDDPADAPSHWQRYGFDGAGRLNAVSSPSGEYSYTYVERSHLLASVTGPVHTVTNSYESGRDAMTSKTNAAASGTVSRFGARYDALGLSVLRTELSSGDGLEMIGEETDDNPLAPQAGLLQDASGGHGPMSTPLESPLQSPLLPSTSLTERDARFEGTTPGAPDQKLEDESFAFLYDGIGNRLTAQKGNDTTAYTPNALNQYTAIGAIEPVYDADGNLFSDGKNRFHWDAENRLTLVEPLVATEGSKRLEFKYDYIGRRVSKQVWTHTGGSWTDESTIAFVYDGWNLIEEVSTSSQSASINHYTWGLDLSGSLQGAGGVGGLLALSNVEGLDLSGVEGPAPSTFHYTFDLNGNVSELLDSTGTIAAHYEYGPFGELTHEFISSNSHLSLLTFNFSTKYYDTELKTLYYGYRYYNPATGRWLNRDPIEESGGLNLYGFVGNDGVNRLDLWGLEILFDKIELKVNGPKAVMNLTRGTPLQVEVDSNTNTQTITGNLGGTTAPKVRKMSLTDLKTGDFMFEVKLEITIEYLSGASIENFYVNQVLPLIWADSFRKARRPIPNQATMHRLIKESVANNPNTFNFSQMSQWARIDEEEHLDDWKVWIDEVADPLIRDYIKNCDCLFEKHDYTELNNVLSESSGNTNRKTQDFWDEGIGTGIKGLAPHLSIIMGATTTNEPDSAAIVAHRKWISDLYETYRSRVESCIQPL